MSEGLIDGFIHFMDDNKLVGICPMDIDDSLQCDGDKCVSGKTACWMTYYLQSRKEELEKGKEEK